jgi:hypothetical protein
METCNTISSLVAQLETFGGVETKNRSGILAWLVGVVRG